MCTFQEKVCLKPLEQWCPVCKHIVILNSSFLWIFQPVHQIRLNQMGQLNQNYQSVSEPLSNASDYLSVSTIICRNIPTESKSFLQQNVTSFLQMFQDTKHLTSPQQTEVSKWVPLSEKLAAKYPSLSRKDCRKRIQYTVCVSCFTFQQHGLQYCEPRADAFADTSCQLCWTAGHSTCSPPRKRVNTFWFPRKIGGCIQF